MASGINTNRIDIVNIGLVIFSCICAFIIPFELFLFAYGVLGPLHYLTEISWLHDKNYYSTSKKDILLLLVISFLLTLLFLIGKHNPTLLSEYLPGEMQNKFAGHLTFIAFGASLFFAFIKKPIIKIIGVAILVLLTFVSSYFIVFFTVFLPTLVHVFLFTSLFMLYGALKSKSKLGYFSVALHIICPLALFLLFPAINFSSLLGINMYINSDFSGLNKFIFSSYFVGVENFSSQESFITAVFQSKYGIAIMRFIAFAYMYHYLNWFSKTEIIKWHQVPKTRLIFIIIAWVISVILYTVNYALGFQWLFLLSFMHVLLEFPLNYVSFVGIFKELTFKKQIAP